MPRPHSHTQPLSHAETHSLSHATTKDATINFTSPAQPSLPFAQPSLRLDPSPFAQHCLFSLLRLDRSLLSLGPWISLGKVLVWVKVWFWVTVWFWVLHINRRRECSSQDRRRSILVHRLAGPFLNFSFILNS